MLDRVHYRCIAMWHLLVANTKLVEIFNQAASTRCGDDNNEKLFARAFAASMQVISAMTGNPPLRVSVSGLKVTRLQTAMLLINGFYGLRRSLLAVRAEAANVQWWFSSAKQYCCTCQLPKIIVFFR